jgi:hypothetical protein
MFSATFEGHADYRPLAAGVTFGALGRPIHFDVLPESAGLRIHIEFAVSRDPKKNERTFDMVMAPNRDRIQLWFYNPSAGLGPSGLTRPHPLLLYSPQPNTPRAITLMFVVDFVTSDGAYRLTYEFADAANVGATPWKDPA